MSGSTLPEFDAALFRALFESASQGILVVAPEGRILLVNRKTCELFGYDRDELVGRELESLLPVALQHQHSRHRAEFFAHPRQRPMGTGLDLKGLRRDGSEFPVDVSLSFVEHDGTRIALALVTDITQRVRMEEELRIASRRKNDFLALMAHELRNPLAAVANAQLVLAQKPGDDQTMRLRAVARRQVAHLNRLVDDLLDVARIEHDRLLLRRETLDLSDAVLNALDAWRPMFEQANHRVKKRLTGEALWIHADPTRIDQIIGNLVRNAIKYTPAGGLI